VVLARTEWLDPGLLAPDIAAALRVPRGDAVRVCRYQRGILVEGASQDAAESLVALLRTRQVEALALPDAQLPVLPRAVNVSLATIDGTGFGTPSVQGAGFPNLWDWNHLALVCAGILLDPAQQAAGIVDRMDKAALEEANDRAALAQHALDRARTRVFPLGKEIARGEADIGQALQVALTGGKPQAPQALDGFGHIGTVVDVIFQRPMERLRLTERSRVQGLARGPSLARILHLTVKALSAQADSAGLSGTTIALAAGADSGEYLFEDLGQFDDYCRWAYFWKLKRQGE
jgi:hypothetical protein